MSDWKRITREISIENLLPEMVTAINKHIEQYNLGPILSEAVMCIQTDSEKVKKGLFGKAETVHTGAVITPRWLIWATSGSKTVTTVLSAQLNDIVVQDYTQTEFMKLIPDSGMNVSGKFTDVSEDSTAFIGLDDGIAGNKFKETVIKAVQDSKK
ncbi:MAG TPA: hypothetical protein VFQ23_22280 [Anaerolineales bacterium]|nr:hypothetical protein [Anaerolineales bacterium]